MLRYGNAYDLIRRDLLPGFTADALSQRRKTKCAARAGGNCVRAAMEVITGPLSAQEAAAIEEVSSCL
jgi:hypothetical protein